MKHRQAPGPAFWIDPLWCAWFSGLIDGEGSFLIGFNKGSSSFSCYIQIKLREDDASVLEEKINYVLHCGRLYHIDYAKARASGERASDQVAWLCYSTGDLANIVIPLLDEFGLRSKKQRDYEIWREAVLLKYESKHSVRQMLRLKRELELTRRNRRFPLFSHWRV